MGYSSLHTVQGLLVDSICEVVAFVSKFGDSVYNFAMGSKHHYDIVVEKLWESEIDFVIRPENVAWCYKLGYESY